MKFKVILAAAALSAGSLLAQPGSMHRGPRGEANLDALTAYLELSEQQVEDFKAARKDFFTNEVRPLMEQIREKRQALREEMQRESPNSAIVGQFQVETAELAGQIREKHAGQTDQLRGMLTDGQRAKLEALEQAAALLPAIQQARGLALLDAPEGGPGMGMGFGRGMRGMGRGPRPPR